MDLRSAAEELYALLPGEFVARRNALAAEAKAAGDEQLAAEVRRLAKPSLAAWAVNLLVRREPDQVEQVLALGAALREAQASMAGDELRALGRQRRQLTAAVTRRAQALAAELGQKVGAPVAAQVEDTLHAAMVDEDAAAAVRTGLLVKALAVTGLGPALVADAVAVPGLLGESVVRRPPSRSGGEREEPRTGPDLTVVPDDTWLVEEAERDLAEAEEALAAAQGRLAKASRKVAKREARGLQLQAELEELRGRIAALEQQVEDNEDELADAEEQRDTRAKAVGAARVAVEAARKALADLG